METARHDTVYAVLRYTNGCAQVLAVYRVHDRAKAWVDRQDRVPGLSYDIEEHVLDREYEGEGA